MSSRLGIGMAVAAASLLMGGGYAEPLRVPEPPKPEMQVYRSAKRGHGSRATPMIMGGKLAKRLKRGKLLFRQ